MRKSLPEGTEFVTMMSSNDFLFASIHNVVETLVIAIILVILVVYFFCRTSRVRLYLHFHYRVAGRHVCLPGGCGVQSQYPDAVCVGAAIGTVVDDAIVVVEAVQSSSMPDINPLTLPRRMRWAM